MRIEVPEFLKEIARTWSPIDQGRVGGVFALLADDEWRWDNRVDFQLSEADKAELEVHPAEIVWAIAHVGVTVAFFEANDVIAVIYLNRRSGGTPGWV